MATTTGSRLATATMAAVLPAMDLDRAERFYTEMLGLRVEKLPEAARAFMVHAGGNCAMMVYETSANAGSATQAGFTVDDFDATVSELRERGITFEEYDMPGLKTVNGVADYDGAKSAWFKDTEGNTIAISEKM